MLPKSSKVLDCTISSKSRIKKIQFQHLLDKFGPQKRYNFIPEFQPHLLEHITSDQLKAKSFQNIK